MLCDNCKKNEANVRYYENINGEKKELKLCEECSKKLGINKKMNFDFSMPIDFSNFFGDFMEDLATPEFMPLLNEVKKMKCDNCGYTFDYILNTGKLGCGECYSVFENELDPIIKKLQGGNRHIGRMGKILDEKEKNKEVNKEVSENTKKISRLEELKQELKKVINEERYEDAAKIRDEIKKLEK